MSLDTEHSTQILAWLDLLDHWNQAFSLTAIPKAQRVAQVILTSIAAIPYLRPGRIADVGSGSGIPGIPLAIFAPGNQYVLIDSNRKKIHFIKQCCTELGLTQVQPVCSRVQKFSDQGFETIITRAFACLHTFLAATKHLGDSRTRWLSFKHSEAALQEELRNGLDFNYTVHQLEIPRLLKPVYLIEARL